jgi:hypothetical protein
MTKTAAFDWLSDTNPLFKAQQCWFDRTYQQPVTGCVMPLESAPFSISCGAGLLAEHIGRFRFTPSIIQRLGQVTDQWGRCIFHESFLNHLQRLRLRIQVQTAAEGTLLLPDEPLLLIQGPKIQALLLESAFQLLMWDSTYWATIAAMNPDTPPLEKAKNIPDIPTAPFNPDGWKIRAAYIGGGVIPPEEKATPWPGITLTDDAHKTSLKQIRRLFQGNQPIADVWLRPLDEKNASLSQTDIGFCDFLTQQRRVVAMTRFQNLYQPVLLKGHPVLGTVSLDYLRQRTLHQLTIFSETNTTAYPRGWFVA